jgi:hypothetical protein
MLIIDYLRWAKIKFRSRPISFRTQVCAVRSGKNQYARTCFEIRDEYRPYRCAQEVKGANGQVHHAYVGAIESSFVALDRTSGKFGVRDAQFAQGLQKRGVSLETVQHALFMGAVRKYASWLNGGSPHPITNLVYFTAVVSEIQERPFPPRSRRIPSKKDRATGKGLGAGIPKRAEKWGMSRYVSPRDRSIAARLYGDFFGAREADPSFAHDGSVLAKKGYKQKCQKETR